MNSRLKLSGGVFGAQPAEKLVDLTIAHCKPDLIFGLDQASPAEFG